MPSMPEEIHPGEEAPAPSQNLPFWLRGFLDYTSNVPSPEIFRLWAGIMTISACMERRAYVKVSGRLLYPNLYVVLVSPPGVGKTMGINEALSLWEELGKLNIAPRALPGKGLIEAIQADKGKRNILNRKTQQYETYHSVIVPAPELGTLIPQYDLQFLSNLNDLYDCGSLYSEQTRSGGLIEIPRPHICLIAGTQPDYLSELLPDTAFGMGFTSRMIMVYSDESVALDLFGDVPKILSDTRMDLLDWLKKITDLEGPFNFTRDCQIAIQKWYDAGMPPRPRHNKLLHYNTRRLAHLVKLSMIMSAADSMERRITNEHFQQALGVLVQAEKRMPEIFRAMGSAGSHANHLEEAYGYIVEEFIKRGQKGVPEYSVIHFLSRRVPTYQIESIIETMLNAQIIKESGNSAIFKNMPGSQRGAGRAFVPMKMDKGALK